MDQTPEKITLEVTSNEPSEMHRQKRALSTDGTVAPQAKISKNAVDDITVSSERMPDNCENAIDKTEVQTNSFTKEVFTDSTDGADVTISESRSISKKVAEDGNVKEVGPRKIEDGAEVSILSSAPSLDLNTATETKKRDIQKTVLLLPENYFNSCMMCKRSLKGNNPLLLGCLHSFCSKCILKRKYFRISNSITLAMKAQQDRQLAQKGDACLLSPEIPEDLGLSSLPESAFQSLTTLKHFIAENNDTLGKMVVKCQICECNTRAKVIARNYFSSFQAKTEEVPATTETSADEKFCTSCEEKSLAVRFCQECDDYLCEDCLTAHKRVKLTKDHTLQLITGVTINEKSEETTLKQYCRKHVKEQIKLFCETCSVLTCRDCQLEFHRDHKYLFVQEAANNQTKILETMRQKLKEKKFFLDQTSTTIEDRLQTMYKCRDKANNDIILFHRQLQQQVTQKCQFFLNKIHEVTSLRESKLSTQLHATGKLSAAVDHCIKFIKFASEQQNHLPLLDAKQMVLEYMTTVMRQKFTTNPVTSSDIIFLPDKDIIKLVSYKLGSLLWGNPATSMKQSSASQMPNKNMSHQARMSAKPKARSSPSTLQYRPQQQVGSMRPMHQTGPAMPISSNQIRFSHSRQMSLPRQQYQHNMFVNRPTQENIDRNGPQSTTSVYLLDMQKLVNVPPTEQQNSQTGSHPYQPKHIQSTVNNASAVYQVNNTTTPHVSTQLYRSGHATSRNNNVSGEIHPQQQHVIPSVNQQCPPKQQPSLTLTIQQMQHSQQTPPSTMQISNDILETERSPVANPSGFIELKPFVQRPLSQININVPDDANVTSPSRVKALRCLPQDQHLSASSQLGNDFPVIISKQPSTSPQNQSSSFLGEVAVISQQQMLPILTGEIEPMTPESKGDIASKTSTESGVVLDQAASISSCDSAFGNTSKTDCPVNESTGKREPTLSPPPLIDLTDIVKIEEEQDLSMQVKSDNEFEEMLSSLVNQDSNKLQEESPETADLKDAPMLDSNTDEVERKFDPNEDWCAVCNNGGDLLCCDTCPKVFHFHCHVPEILSSPPGLWQCMLCRDIDKLLEVESKYPKRKRTTGLMGKELKLCEKLLLEIFCHRQSMIFHLPVRSSVPNYHKVIKEPMDLSKIKKKLLSSNFNHYESESEFLQDIQLMFTNCFRFNGENSQYGLLARELQLYWIERVKERLPLHIDFVDQLMKEQRLFLDKNSSNQLSQGVEPNAILDEKETPPSEKAKYVPYENDTLWKPNMEELDEDSSCGTPGLLVQNDLMDEGQLTRPHSEKRRKQSKSGIVHIK
ncbi:transcription intermediary factor 1-alpha-like isoform X1 [Clavelina lepadiformis]|uniref:transcription intermediary factor 1-alpha-like isoform X1 n=1 Tax=Clavelina lepadiformis TaxID=159417 RepID=UPI004041171A